MMKRKGMGMKSTKKASTKAGRKHYGRRSPETPGHQAVSDAAANAAHAKRLLEDPMLIEALANIRAAAIKAWEALPLPPRRSASSLG
jgi:hypothetical protein